MERILIYTIALDDQGQTVQRCMAKILVSSLLRSYFTGDILLLHNGTAPVFRVARQGVEEVMLSLPPELCPAEAAQALRFQAGTWIQPGYDWICFLDCDSIALRNIDHLFPHSNESDLLWHPEPLSESLPQWEINRSMGKHGRRWHEAGDGGCWAVGAGRFANLMEECARMCTELHETPNASLGAAAWNRLLVTTRLRHRRFEKEEIALPLWRDRDYLEFRQASLLRAKGAEPALKLEFLMGQFLGRYAGEPAEVMLSLLEP